MAGGTVFGRRYSAIFRPRGPLYLRRLHSCRAAHRPNGSTLPFGGLPIQRGGLWGMPAAVPVPGGKTGYGRTVRLHPQEALLQQARALQHSEGFAEYRQRRVVVEHRLALLVQLGIRQSRYFGRIRTRFQLYLAATVANLTLVAAKAGWTGETGSGPSAGSALATGMVNSAANSGAEWLGQIWALTLLAAALLPKSLFPTRGFRPDF